MKIAVCDDDLLFLDILSEFCEKFERNNKIPITLIRFADGESVLEYYKYNKDIDLFVLDIKMKGLDGLQVAERIRSAEAGTKIVFLTSAIEYGPQGYEIGISRYWLKPLQYNKFETELLVLYEQIKKESMLYFIENAGSSIEKVYYDEILYIETKGRKTCVHKTKSSYISVTTMRDYEKKLDNRFFRCHAAYIVNMNYVKKIEGLEVFLYNGESVYISKGKKKAFILAIDNYFNNKCLRQSELYHTIQKME